MDALRPTTWLLSLGLHAAVLAAFVGIGGGAALESGSGDDMVMVEQGIALEGLTKLRRSILL
jgi:periplasmic protein TonB